MATIKSYTDVSQSKKLAEILPLESADMYWWHNGQRYYVETKEHNDFQKSDIPCWSLAALLGVLSYPSLHKTFSGWRCDSYNKEGTSCILGEPKDNPVDACYKMIIELHEQKLL